MIIIITLKNMKQLLSMAKQRKDNKLKPIGKQLVLKQPQDQQHNFIYEDMDDEENGPTQQEVRTYAKILGIKLPQQEDLLYIARECLAQETPDEWECKEDERGQIIYLNRVTGQISFEHPCDVIFRQKVITQRKKKVENLKKNIGKINLPKSKTAFVENVFKKKQQSQQVTAFVNENIKKRDKNAKVAPLNLNLNQNMRKQVNAQFLYDDSDKEEKESYMKNQINKCKILPKSSSKQNHKKSQNIKGIFDNQEIHPQLVMKKRKQVQERIQKKYQEKNRELQEKYKQTIKTLENTEVQVQSANDESIKYQMETKFQRRKKQIQMKQMAKHSINLEKLRVEAQRQYRKEILQISEKYQIEQLFTQMAQCRKFINREKTESERAKYMEEIEQNIRMINNIQIDKLLAEAEKDCRSVMYKMLEQLVNAQNVKNLSWEKQSQLSAHFNETIGKIIQKYKGNSLQQPSFLPNEKVGIFDIMKQDKAESQLLYKQLEGLKQKLRELKQENNTQRSNLSDKQNKLFELLQNRVGSSSERSHYL